VVAAFAATVAWLFAAMTVTPRRIQALLWRPGNVALTLRRGQEH
jgi:hypothetical protein